MVCGRPCSTAPVLGAGEGGWACKAGPGVGGSQWEQAECMRRGVRTRKHHPPEIRGVSLTVVLTACSFRTRKSQQTAVGATHAPRQKRHPGADRQHSPADTQLIRGFSDPERPPEREGTESAACGVPPTTFTPRRVWGLGRGMERGRAHCELLIHPSCVHLVPRTCLQMQRKHCCCGLASTALGVPRTGMRAKSGEKGAPRLG